MLAADQLVVNDVRSRSAARRLLEIEVRVGKSVHAQGKVRAEGRAAVGGSPSIELFVAGGDHPGRSRERAVVDAGVVIAVNDDQRHWPTGGGNWGVGGLQSRQASGDARRGG